MLLCFNVHFAVFFYNRTNNNDDNYNDNDEASE